ncbi:Hcp family type VI secretion system effector [Roseateles sp. GG27B]
MPGNSFIKFAGITDGESLQETNIGKGEGWIEIGDWSWDIEAEHSAFKGSGAAVGKPTPGTLSFSHFFDNASPEIMNRIIRGTSFDTATVQMLKQTGEGKPTVYFEIAVSNVFITKVSTKGAEDGSLNQDVEMVFKEIIVNYKPQLNTGTLGPAIPFKWNIPTMNDAVSGASKAVLIK